MKFYLHFAFMLFTSSVIAQPTLDYVVQTWAETDAIPNRIILHWEAVDGAESYTIYRKEKTETSWGNSIATLDATTTLYEDTDVALEVSYEYKVQKTGNVSAYGYINVGIEVPATHQRGRLLLLVDDTMADALTDEIDQLIEDLVGDGWKVNRQDVDREGTAIEIKQIITDEYAEENIDAIFCLGHVPVPYSGNYAPDGHTNNHEGAWPVDGYYADINGIWTDLTVDNITASQERNQNIPGDGKFDSSFFPSDLEMQIGRVDFSNMPAFALSEEELLRQYLNKNHAFKIGQIQVEMKAVVDDNFGGFNGEAFAGSGWKSFAPLLHPDNVAAGDYRTSMDTSTYIWSYGCGGGSYSSCSGVGTTNDLAGDSLQGIFSCLFGSYFGDWDSQNNLMRATLAQGTILTNCWNGRPHWYFHHMGLGENIGYSTKVSMNNNGAFYNSPLAFLAKIVGMGLMGDPSLRMHVIPPASDLATTFNGHDVELNWTASNDASVGYYVYRSTEFNSHYVLLNDEPVATTNFIDGCIDISDTYHYMVRATKLETSSSGSYHNLSLGTFSSMQIEVMPVIASFSAEMNENELSLTNTSTNADSWFWEFGDGTTSTEFEPQHIYETPGEYIVSLVVSNGCFLNTLDVTVTMNFTATNDLIAKAGITVSPNPSTDWFTINAARALPDASIRIFDGHGKVIKTLYWANNSSTVAFSLAEMPAGFYFVRIVEDDSSAVLKIEKL